MAATPLIAATAAKAQEALKRRKVRFVHVGLFDYDGCFRERRLPLDLARLAFDGKLEWCNNVRGWDSADAMWDPRPVAGEAVRIDPTSGRDYGFEDDAALYVADYIGVSAQASPRNLLAAQIKKADAMGYAVRCAFECELFILDETAASLREKNFDNLDFFAPDNRCWDGMPAAENAGFIADLDAAMADMDIPIFAFGLELGPGCFEATLRARDAMRAADDAALFKVFTKAFCHRHGLTASFMAQMDASVAGLSGHIHLSLADKKTAKPVFFDKRQPDNLSKAARHFTGGMLAHMADHTALSAHTVNAYRRLVPGNWSPRTPTWGLGNYSVAVRAIAAQADTARLEFRVPASDTNPHLAMAQMLATGLWGIENKTEPPKPVAGDARALKFARKKALPRNLLDAAERLLASKSARALYGDAFVEQFATSRLNEYTVCSRQVGAFERGRYMDVV